MSSLDISQRMMQALDRPASIERAAHITEREQETKDAPWRVLITKGHINAARLRKAAPWCVTTGSMLTVAGLLILTHGPINLVIETSRALTGTVSAAWSMAVSTNERAMTKLGLTPPNAARPAVAPVKPTEEQQDEFGMRAEAIQAVFRAMPPADKSPGAGITPAEFQSIVANVRGWIKTGIPSGSPLTEVDQTKFWSGDPPKNSGAWMTRGGSDVAAVRALVSPRPGAPAVRWMYVCRAFAQNDGAFSCKEVRHFEFTPLIGAALPLSLDQYFLTGEALGVAKAPGYLLKKGS